MSNADPIKVGIIGLGRSGYDIHVRTAKAMPQQFKVVAVTDLIKERRDQAAAEIGAKPCGSIDELLAQSDVEMVVVSSFNHFHAPNAVQALNAGKHVLCEKPFGLTTADADQMIAASQKAGRVLQPFQQRRYEDDLRKVKEICQSGILGRLEFIRICWHNFKRRWDWQTTTERCGGTMNNNGPHLIDFALELYGDGEPEVWADLRRCLCSGDAEDHMQIVLRGPGKPTVNIELSDVFPFANDRWLICGTNGGLRGGADYLEWKYVHWNTMPPRPLTMEPTPDRSYNSEKLNWQTGSWKAGGAADAGGGAAPASGPAMALYNDLFESIRNGKPQVITPQSVRRRVQVMEKARKVSGFYK